MEPQNTTIDPQTDFKKGETEALLAPLEDTLQRSSRIKNIQTTVTTLLLLAVVINYLDRNSLSIANSTIREESGLTVTGIGVLLSVFSLAYDTARLPCEPLLDRKGPHIILGLGMPFWSLFQAVSGMVHSFTQFVLACIGMGIDEAPINPCGVKVTNDRLNIKERGRPMGFFNAASMAGVAISPPIFATIILMMDRRWVFITIGVLGIFVTIGWYMPYRNWGDIPLTVKGQAYLSAGSVNVHRDPLNSAERHNLLKNRTMWGMMFGFSGINYTAWLYLAWLPGYLQTAYNPDLKSVGFMVAVPFLFGAADVLINGRVIDQLVKDGITPIKNRKIRIITGVFCSVALMLIVSHTTTSIAAVLLIGMALFCIHFAGTSCWGLIHVVAVLRMTVSAGSIQNFAGFICVSFAPVVTGFIVGITHSFQLALVICGCVTVLGTLAYIFLVRQPTSDLHSG